MASWKPLVMRSLRLGSFMAVGLLAMCVALAAQGRMVIGWPQAIGMCLGIGVALGVAVTLVGAYFDWVGLDVKQDVGAPKTGIGRALLAILPVAALIALFWWLKANDA